MPTIKDIETGVLARLEESSTPGFWNAQYEIRHFIVEALNEAVLLTAEPEKRADVPFVLTANTTLFSVPAEAVAVTRMEAAGAPLIRRCTVWDLDRMLPGWQNETGTFVKYWFPLGLTKFGIYPKLTADVQALLTYVALPITTWRPFTGVEPVPFQQEYLDGFEHYGSHRARLKEGGLEFQQSMAEYNDFLDKMAELSRFALRKGSIRFTRRGGIPSARVSEVTVS